MNLKLLILFLCSLPVFAQIPLENQLLQLNEYNDQIGIEEVIQKEKEGAFTIPFTLETYKFISGKEANWMRIPIPPQSQKQYISIENSMLEALDFYLATDTSFHKLVDLKEKKLYRFPLVEIPINQTPSLLFIRTKDALSFRTEFIIKNFNEFSLRKTTQRDYFIIGAFLISMFVLLIATCVFFLYKNEYAILWFGLHLFLMLIEYLISTGAFSQWVISNEIIMRWGLDHVSLMLSSAALMEFYRRFYPYNKQTYYCKTIFFIIAICCYLTALLSIIDGFLGNVINVEWFAQTVLNFASLIAFLTYIVLTYYKVIPFYLFIAFLLPVFGILANTGNVKEMFTNENVTYFMFQAVYFGILIETIIIIFYIMKISIDGELKANALEEENDKLKLLFDEQLTVSQERHQNAIMNDVHDSFGGYIEALKLTLINKNIKEEAVDEILDSFITDYRVLLNSLHIPNIDAKNFTEAIASYANKMDSLSEINIHFIVEQNASTNIPQNIAKFIYKAASELTTNAIKYAKASTIHIILDINANSLDLSVEDNGIGFTEDALKPNSYGINSIRERAKNLKGYFRIKCLENQGSHVNLSLPIPRSPM